MNPLRGSNMSPDRLSFCITSSASVSVMSFSCAAFIRSSIGTFLPTLASSSCISSLMSISLFLLLAGISVAILSMSKVPVFSSIATNLRQ